ncbi:acyl-CoA dehydrogenase [Dickeya sp. CFBP 2040]|uniref:acyl-CoA dehydrogenase family protein n=1 Tax=Dickeya sp. CFBP 2040 TaxID=2718531 RepID=UPI0014484133|nr:acyl-CoA dehydrogenase family protein [Dickeya sp. CFBP 2040]NKI73715.1 acyl-CoA dehydrogenase [Dickeya sp. CFBP 2040]
MMNTHHDIILRDALITGDDAEYIAERIRATNDPVQSRIMLSGWSRAAQLNMLGLPERYAATGMAEARRDLALSERLKLYENIGYVSPALIFLAPGPGMAAYVVAGLGTERQQDSFFEPFLQGLRWSCFAMTEPTLGSDARAMQTTATRVDGGYLLSGEKMLIGNGTIADTGVVFARTSQGALGVDAFILNPAADGVQRRRLQLNGLEGISLAHLTFRDLFIPDEQALGQHLKPTQRFARSALATFDALRPCVGAIALGVARRALHDWQADEVTTRYRSSVHFSKASLELDAAYLRAVRVCRQLEAHQTPDCTPGMSKTDSVRVAESIISRLIHAMPAQITPLHHRLWRAFRDVKAFEYTEGTRHIHMLSSGFKPSSEAA